MTGQRRPGQPAREAGPRSAQKPSQRSRRADAPRQAAYETVRAVATKDAYANLVLPGLLRDRRITDRDAAFATELTYGTLRMQGLYDAVLARCVDRPLDGLDDGVLDALRLGAHQLLGMRVPPHAAVGETVALVRDNLGGGPAGLTNAVLRKVGDRDVAAWVDELAEGSATLDRLALQHSHPLWVVRALREALAGRGVAADRLDTELEQLLAADNAAAKVTLVARPGLATRDELVVAGGEPSAVSPYAVLWPGGDPSSLPAVREGRAGVQDEGSQLVALALASAPVEGRDERWLDLCAGPGGKAALLGALVAARGGTLTAIEQASHRAALVRSAVAALGESVVVRRADGRELGEQEPGGYDRVLVDAPCTGLGALRRRPEARWRRQPSDVAGLAPLQRALLDSAASAVRPGGLVAYAVCSPHVAETRLVVDDVVRRRGDLEVVDARPMLPDVPALDDAPTVQLWPHRQGTDAMFLALLRRT